MTIATEAAIALFSVKGGKYHKPAEACGRDNAFRPTKTACGLTVTPLNYFASAADADKYTGGRLHQHACSHCATKD